MRKDLARQASPARQLLPRSIKQTPVTATSLPFCNGAKPCAARVLPEVGVKDEAVLFEHQELFTPTLGAFQQFGVDANQPAVVGSG